MIVPALVLTYFWLKGSGSREKSSTPDTVQPVKTEEVSYRMEPILSSPLQKLSIRIEQDESGGVVYSVADDNGTLARSTFTPTLVGVSPVALDDAGAARQGAAVTVSPLSNDAAGAASVPLDPESLRYVDGDDLVETVTVPGVGEYAIDREIEAKTARDKERRVSAKKQLRNSLKEVLIMQCLSITGG